jgi:hypothetical protein
MLSATTSRETAPVDRRRLILENRHRIRDQAFGEAAYDPALEPLARHEVHLDRRLEKHLTMLLTLQDRRRKSVLQKMQKAEQPDDADEPEQPPGTNGS